MATPESTCQRLLIIEDDEITLEGFAVAMRGEGYAVSLAANSQQALTCLQRQPLPQLILLDMMMSDGDGWSFLEQRKRNPTLAAIPVIVTTALPVACGDWATSLGANGCLQKPIETEVLVKEVGRCLGNKKH